jgi:hypothetical protein
MKFGIESMLFKTLMRQDNARLIHWLLSTDTNYCAAILKQNCDRFNKIFAFQREKFKCSVSAVIIHIILHTN